MPKTWALGTLIEKKPMNGNVLVDSNILVYFVDKNELQKHIKAKELLKSIDPTGGQFFVSLQNLREFSNIAFKKSKLPAAEINRFVNLFSSVFAVLTDTKEDIENANIKKENFKSSFWDSLLASTMQRNEIKKILTENIADFKAFKEIEAINPF